MKVPWLLRIPGLRRYGAQITTARRHLARLRARADGLRARVRSHRANFVRRIRIHKSRQPDPHVLRQVLAARHAALVANAEARGEAARRDELFMTRSPSYAAAVAEAAAGPSRPTECVEIEGLRWHVPEGSRGTHLADRLLGKGWLPFPDILATREVALGTTMLDVGANIGTTSIPRVVLGDFQYIYAAEPDPANYACLVQNISANHLRGFVLPDRVAIGAADGDATLNRRTGIGGHHLVPGAQASAGVEVACLTLDSWVERLGVDVNAVTFIKVDTQGWESRVLRGAPTLLAQRHIAWQVEFSPKLLRRAGSSAVELLEQVERHFTHFIDLAARTPPRSKPVSEVRDALGYLDRGFTDLLLYKADPRTPLA